jgi:hypothetical protein
MSDPPVLFRVEGPVSFVLGIEETMYLRPEESSVERRDVIVAMTAHSIKHLSRTGVKLEEIRRWVHANMPQQEAVTTFVQNVPIEVLVFIQRLTTDEDRQKRSLSRTIFSGNFATLNW